MYKILPRIRKLNELHMPNLMQGGGLGNITEDAKARYELIKDGYVVGIWKCYYFLYRHHFQCKEMAWWIIAVFFSAWLSCFLTGDANKISSLLAWALPYAIIPAMKGIHAANVLCANAYEKCSYSILNNHNMLNRVLVIKNMKKNIPLPENFTQFIDDEIARQAIGKNESK